MRNILLVVHKFLIIAMLFVCVVFVIDRVFCLQVVGIKGATVLSLHRPYDVSKGIAIDDLHAIFLGITLDLLRFWFDKKHRTKTFSLRSQVCSHLSCQKPNTKIDAYVADCSM